ncbi:MAG: hypothetical protein HY662_04565 [Chloroflexi bacterium]|nr:hypothetical protein [Chloroflexota bacterium]
MKTLQFLIDNICADFTVDSLLGMVRTCLAKGPSTLGDIIGAIMQRDRSLDIRCAKGLAEGAVLVLSDCGEVEIKGALVYVTGHVANQK